MCLATPWEIEELFPDREMAIVNLGGVKKEVSTKLLDDLEIGDWVLVHVGYALVKLNEEEAKRTLAEMIEAGQAVDTPDEHETVGLVPEAAQV